MTDHAIPSSDRWEILWGTQKSQRYHARRMAFYGRWNKATAFVGVIGGSAVFASFGQYVPAWVASIAAALVVLMSGADLVAGTADMARMHNDLRRRFCELECTLSGCDEITPATIAAARVERLKVESDEPPTYVALDLLCHNELVHAYAHLEDLQRVHLPWYVSLTANLFHWADTGAFNRTGGP